MKNLKKIFVIFFICLLTTYSFANNKGGNSGNNSGGNSGNNSGGNSGNNSGGNSGNNSGNSNKSNNSNKIESRSLSNSSSSQSSENHGQKVSTYAKIAKSLGLKANVGTHLANFGTPDETGIADLQNEISKQSNLIETKTNEIQSSKVAVADLENQLTKINTEISSLQTQLDNTELTEEQIKEINVGISNLEKQRESIIDQVEAQEASINLAEIDLNNASSNLITAESELSNRIQEVESKTGVTGWATVNLDTNGDGKINEADIKN